MKGLLTSLITVLTFTGLQAQSLPAAPKLVVGLTIDQLRTDYLEAFSSLYGEKGFKRLWKEGRVFHNAEYTFCGIDRASAIAAIYSGTTPSMNGIISQRWMDASTLRPVNSTDDTAFMGYYTDQTVAPTKLLTSTIADELKIATQYIMYGKKRSCPGWNTSNRKLELTAGCWEKSARNARTHPTIPAIPKRKRSIPHNPVLRRIP